MLSPLGNLGSHCHSLGGQDEGCLLTVVPAVSDPNVPWLGRDPLPLLCQSFRDRDTLGPSRECVADLMALSGWAWRSGVMEAHQLTLDLQLQLRWRWSGCGYSSARSQPVGTGGQSAEA